MSTHPSANADLLFGLLAVQTGLLSREGLLDGLGAWRGSQAPSLRVLLEQRGGLTALQRQTIEALVQCHVAKFGDLSRCLDAVPVDAALRRVVELGPAGAPEATLAPLSAAPTPSAAFDLPALPPPPRPVAARYRPVKLHARGGLGEVHVALDGELNRLVALKEIQRQHADQADSRARFLREAEITGKLEHPGIVPIYGMGAYPDGRPYYAMRFIKGETLHDAIKRYHDAPQPNELALRGLLRRFIDVCNAMAYAHSRGVIHRDLKPANIMLGEFGETLVVDWGLAKPIEQPEAPGPAAGAAAAASTGVGQAVGTPAFMPPEQARGEADRVDQRSDVFALGATLYNLLTGQAPYEGGLVSLLAQASQALIKPARHVNRRVPAALEAVCARAMALRPEDRYPTAAALAADVERWLADEPVGARREPVGEKLRRWGRRHRALMTSGIVLLLLTIGGLGVGLHLLGQEQARTASQRDRAEEAEQEVTAQLGRVNANLTRALTAERKLQASLEQSEANLKLARKAVLETLGVAKEHPLLTQPNLSKELHQLRRLLLEKSLPFYQNFQALRRGDVGVNKELWQQHQLVGYIQDELGDRTAALREFRAAERVARQLVQDYPKGSDYRHDLATTLNDIAVLLGALGRPEEARAHYTASADLARALVKAHPRTIAYPATLASVLTNRGNQLQQLGRPGEAIQDYAEAADLRRGLVQAQPSARQYQSGLARTLMNLGNLRLTLRQGPEALKNYTESVQWFRALLKAHPDWPDYQDGLATALSNQGNLHRALAQPKEAGRLYTESITIRRALIRAQPAVLDHQTALAGTLNNLGGLRQEEGELSDAVRHLAEAIGLRRELRKAQPSVSEHLDELAGSLSNLGLVQRHLGRPKEALASYTEAIDLLRGLVKAQPKVPTYAYTLSLPLIGRASLRRQLREGKGALEDSTEALAVLGKLTREHPKFPGAEYSRYLAHHERARTLAALNRHRDALPDWGAAVTLAPPDRAPGTRLGRAESLAQVGEHDRAAAEAVELARMRPGPNACYDLACILSLSAAGAARDPLRPLPVRERQADQRGQGAVSLLRRAERAGLFRDLRVLPHMDKDSDLDFLRGREDYRRLRASLGEGGPRP